jgi:hypothetical protein
MKKCGAGVLILRNLERWKFLVAEGRQKLVDNFYSALSVEQNQVPRGSIFSSLYRHFYFATLTMNRFF